LTVKKTYFVSDVHLGAPALKNNKEREKLFVNWLDEVANDAGEIYLMGDIFDFWYEYRKVAPRGFVRTLGKIAQITDSGIPVHFFTGNHDIWVYDYLPSELNIILHREPITRTINGKVFFLGHGDGLDPNEKGYLMLKRLFTSKTAQFLFSRLHPNFAFWVGHKWAKNSRLSKGIGPEESIDPSNEPIVTFAEKMSEYAQIDYYIFGHRHIMLSHQIKPKAQVTILGEWINHFSYAVFDGEKVELKKFNNKGL
jgi:UDP-2,3-diacylglucosamine hydrolase